MKQLLFVPLFLCFSVLHAQTLTIGQTTIAEVKIFFQGAEIVRTFDCVLASGKTELNVIDLSTGIDPNSLVVSAGSSVKIISMDHEIDFENRLKRDASLRTLQDSLENFRYTIRYKEQQIAALDDEKKVLLQNATRIQQTQGLSVNEIETTSVYLRKKQEEINALVLKRQQEIQVLERQRAECSARFQKQALRDSSSTATVRILVESAVNGKATFRLSYYVKSCGWAPAYNIYSQGPGKPIELDYKAHVLNNSGEDWHNVSVSLIAGNPSRSLSVPVMETWVLSYSYRKRNGKVHGYNQSGNEGELSKKQIKNGTDKQSALETQEIEMEEGEMLFKPEGVHTIPSGLRKYQMDVAHHELQASYIYQAIPKIDSKAYLVARIKDWEQLKLIEGEANVFFNETFAGRTYIDPLGAGDSLEFSLGPDPAIQITRVKKKDLNTRKFIGLQLTENFSYEIDVRNLNSSPVTIEVIDQVPIAQQDDIQISVEEKDGADYLEGNGKLSWKLEIPPQKTVKLKMGYSVKYPKDKIVIIKRTGKVICPKFR